MFKKKYYLLLVSKNGLRSNIATDNLKNILLRAEPLDFVVEQRWVIDKAEHDAFNSEVPGE